MPENNGDCAPIPDKGVDMCVCSIAIGPSKFNDAEIKKAGKSIKNFCIGVYYSSGNPCELAKKNYIQRYARKHVEAVATYWKKQLGDIVDTWVKTAEELKSLKANLKRYKMYTYYYCCCYCCCYYYHYYYYYYYYCYYYCYYNCYYCYYHYYYYYYFYHNYCSNYYCYCY